MNLMYLVVVAGLVLSAPAQAKRDLADLRQIGQIASKGRVQDQQLPVVEALIKAGSPAVPFLLSKLEDRTRIPGPGTVLDFWPRVEVRHVALLVLCDLFSRADGMTATVPGFTWDEILARHDQDPPAWGVFHSFVAQHGRSGIRLKIEQLLAPCRGKVVWDTTERYFRPRT